jgi:N-acetylglucosaminyl-diphospho-decaprenol L-rhamnosyltransferase
VTVQPRDAAGGAPGEPGGTFDEPGGTFDEPGGSFDGPGGTFGEPGGSFDGPGGTFDEPGVTAVVVTHNSARHLAPLARALSAGSLAPTRMLAIDNLSSDDTVAQARSAGFEVLETDANRGFGAGCNCGLKATRTELVLFCNPDVRPSATALERLAAALAQAPRAAIAGAVGNDQARPRGFSTISKNVAGFLPARLRDRLRGARRPSPAATAEAAPTATGPSPPTADAAPLEVDYVEGALLLCRAAPLRSLEGFDESFFLYFEEEDLSRRLREHGWQTLLVPSAAFTHEERGSSEDFGQAAMAPFFTNSLYRYYRKYNPRWYAELARCVIAACVMLDRGYRALTGRPQVYAKEAALAPFRDIESVRRSRERRSAGNA